MMQVLTNESGGIVVSAALYDLVVAEDRPFVSLYDADGQLLCELFVPSSIHPLHDRDDTVALDPWQVTTVTGHPGSGQAAVQEIVLSVGAQSSTWQEKEYRFRCRPHRILYEVAVRGEAMRLAEANYFGGYYSANLRWGSGFFRSGQTFRQVFNPEPNIAEQNFAPANESQSIDLMGVPLPSRGDWFYTPPPFAFAVEGPASWFAVGVAAQPGANRFTAMHYRGRRDSFYLTLDYEGHTEVDGRYELPAISFDFAPAPGEPAVDDPYEALALHVAALRADGLLPAANTPAQSTPRWWSTPIFCGWGAQCHLASGRATGFANGHAPDFARQEHYETFLATLEAEQLSPGIIVLDDKWQATYGRNEVDEEKWPDLPGFIRNQHEAGRRVLLWLKAWDPEGVPAEETITNAAGLPIAVDPTNPAFERRLRDSVRRMLSDSEYGADGFKIDFTARIPSGPGIHIYGDNWGLELMKTYLGIIFDEAKRTKPDALIMTHTPHPYLAGVLDMIRLNDMNMGADIPQAMRHRARIARIACPEAIIDTDNWPIANIATWRTYLPLQAELGVPSLYYASHVDGSGEPLEASDYEMLRRIWSELNPSPDPEPKGIEQEAES